MVSWCFLFLARVLYSLNGLAKTGYVIPCMFLLCFIRVGNLINYT